MISRICARKHGGDAASSKAAGTLRPGLAAAVLAALLAPSTAAGKGCAQAMGPLLEGPGPTLPPANRANLVPGTEVSVAGEGGNLENAVVVGPAGKGVRIAPRDGGAHRIVPQGGGAPGDRRGHAHPEGSGLRGPGEPHGRRGPGPAQILRAGRPARAPPSPPPGTSPPRSPRKGWRSSEGRSRPSIGSTRGSKESPAFIRRNDALMARLREEAERQGIVCSLAESELGSSRMLVIEGVRPNGNRVAQMYLKAAERLNVREITVSLLDNHMIDSIGFFSSEGGRTRAEIGWEALLDMFQGKRNSTAIHEFRHGMFKAKGARGDGTTYLHFLEARKGKAKRNLGGKAMVGWNKEYGERMSLEEIYNHSLDLVRYSSMMRKTFEERHEGAFSEMSEALSSFFRRISESLRRFFSGIFRRGKKAPEGAPGPAPGEGYWSKIRLRGGPQVEDRRQHRCPGGGLQERPGGGGQDPDPETGVLGLRGRGGAPLHPGRPRPDPEHHGPPGDEGEARGGGGLRGREERPPRSPGRGGRSPGSRIS